MGVALEHQHSQGAAGARVGTASLRRASQVMALRPDLVTAPVRGNVQTRLAKLDSGEFDAIVLDVPNHPSAIEAVAPMLSVGGPLACYDACRCVLRARTVRMRRGSLAGATALSSNDRLPRRPSASRCTLKFAGFAPSRAQIKAGTAADVPCVCPWSIAVRTRPRSPPGATSLPRVAHLKPTPA